MSLALYRSRVRSSEGLGGNLDILDLARWRRNGRTVFSQPIQVELDGFADCCLGLRKRSPGSNAAGKIWDIGREIRTRVFNDDGVAHRSYLNFASDRPA